MCSFHVLMCSVFHVFFLVWSLAWSVWIAILSLLGLPNFICSWSELPPSRLKTLHYFRLSLFPFSLSPLSFFLSPSCSGPLGFNLIKTRKPGRRQDVLSISKANVASLSMLRHYAVYEVLRHWSLLFELLLFVWINIMYMYIVTMKTPTTGQNDCIHAQLFNEWQYI